MSSIKDLTEYVKKGIFYKAVVEDGSDIIFIVDYEGNILYHNPSVEETLGHKPNSLTGKNFFNFIEPEMLKKVEEDFRVSTNKPYQESIEFRFLCEDGTYKYLEFNSINLKHKEGVEGMILDCRDITQRKKDAEELLRAQKAKEQFLANMSHEIRTPINGIAGMASLLSEASTDDDRMKYINAIKNSTENLKVIINDILDISIIESGKLKFEKIGFSIKYQLGAVVDTFIFQCKEKSINLTYNVDPSAEGVYLGDPVRLNQILINLISNAVKFTHVGAISVSVKEEKFENGLHYMQFKVSDTGVGIHPEKIQRIFESFTQADESVTRRYGGTGLGLSIVKQLVELQNGSISVESEEDLGTTFTFILPFESGMEADLVQPRSARTQPTEVHRFPNLRVLLVEDNDINRLYALNILKKWKCDVQIAENGYIALERMRNNEFDIILMDVQMPVMDGYETTQNIRSTFQEPHRSIPIIALTANAIKGDNEKCLEVGMNDYLSKPFQPEDLFKALSKFAQEEPVEKIEKTEEVELNVPSSTNHVDLSYLKKVCNGDQNFIQEMIATFIQNTPDVLNEMKEASSRESWSEVGQLAHKLKPSITFMGINSLKTIVKEIEHEGKEGLKTESLPEKVNLLNKVCNEAFRELEAIIE